jgi:glycosyltransferase involved in cell wall biosynthesis
MKISIVTISFNQAEFLERTIRSVVEQDYPNIEYIVVDPGSTDGSREIISRYAAQISKVILEPDQGPTDGLNKGFSVATGEVFGFLNSDDTLLPGALSKVAQFFQIHPTIDVVSGHAILIDQQDKHLRQCFSDRLTRIRAAYSSAILMQPSTFFRAHQFRAIGGFQASNRFSWDADLWSDMCIHGATFAVMDEFLSCYRLHSSSITSSGKFSEVIKTYKARQFSKVMGREYCFYDIPMSALFRLSRHFMNPRDVYQRITNGKVVGRQA